jgi:UDP-N-acetylglucosamine--N-acetylmuramyl-(pentapeptide) pyrophosphoryl-undecaprenol N-acetylglucosamine transferase
MVTGNPVRESISHPVITRTEGIRFFALDENKKTVFVVGGSLGAKSINEAVDNHLDEFPDNGLQLIWQTGKLYAQKAKERIKGKQGTWANDFITKMEYAYAAADMVIARAGAMTVSELCVVKKPVLFVPYPFAAEDHQTVNAKTLVNKNAALMVKDSEAVDKAVQMIIELSKDEGKQNELKKNIGALAVTNADEVIAGKIIDLI